MSTPKLSIAEMTGRDIATDSFWRGKTFDDFLFRPQKGIIESRTRITLTSPLTNNLPLDLPIVSSNMDSVTGKTMAQAMALEGGLGVIHRALSIEQQAGKVTQVKRSHSAIIERPLCLPSGTSMREARAFARQHDITGILIETRAGSGILAGLLSDRDIPWSDEHIDDTVDTFMTPYSKLHTHPPGISPEDAERILFEKRIERLPLVDDERRIHGLITRKDIVFLRRRPFAAKDGKGRLLVAAAIGARGDYLERSAALLEAGADCLFIDIAHGHSVIMEDAIGRVRKQFGDIELVCGNVATAEGARYLRDAGASAIKVGVGPGRGCRTRLETAAGVPQLQAIQEAWSGVRDTVPIVADGGVRYDKDIFMALICGASAVMLGSALSGTDEAPGRVIEDPATHTKKKIYRGMTSPEAVFESLYDTEDGDAVDAAMATPAEGQELQVPYKGSVVDILHRIRGHLRSAVSYAGETSLESAREKILSDPARFLIPLSGAAYRESYDR
ncbi:MAG: IMP dehydrogenase [Gammaproteobacteria bacterium]|nr:IMP dehydrogenase [Gammaproteobacteria bacterium]